MDHVCVCVCVCVCDLCLINRGAHTHTHKKKKNPVIFSTNSLLLNSATTLHGGTGLEVFFERREQVTDNRHTPGHAKEPLSATPPWLAMSV